MPNLKLLKKQNYFHSLFETKGIEVIKKDGKEIVKVSGYASTINKDRVGDVVLPSAFASTLETYKENPVILLQHKMDQPIGKATDLKIDETGLYIEAEISEDINGCISAIKNGVLKGFSIGYKVKDWEEKFVNEEYIFEIKEVELLEISVVSIPANPHTLIKSMQDCFEKSVTEEVIEEKQEEITPEEVKTEEVVIEEEVIVPEAIETSDEVEIGGETPPSTANDTPKEDEKGLKDFSFKIFEKRLEITSSEIKENLEKSLSEKIDKALGDKAESVKSELVESMKADFIEYTKSQENLLTVMVDSLKSFDKELAEMFALVKSMRASKGYNYEKPIEVKETKQDTLTKALKLAKGL